MLSGTAFDGYPEQFVSEELVAAWELDPRCVECGDPVRSASEAALLVGPNRVAHRARCFIPALVRRNPHLKLLIPRRDAEEVIEGTPPAIVKPGPSPTDAGPEPREPHDG